MTRAADKSLLGAPREYLSVTARFRGKNYTGSVAVNPKDEVHWLIIREAIMMCANVIVSEHFSKEMAEHLEKQLKESNE